MSSSNIYVNTCSIYTKENGTTIINEDRKEF